MSDLSQPLLDKENLDRSSVEPIIPRRSKSSSWSVFQLVSAAVIGGLITTVLHRCIPVSSKAGSIQQEVHAETVPMCPSTDALPIIAPRTNIWKNLDLEEALDVRAWLSDPERGLNLTHAQGASPSDNYIQLVEVAHPPKSQALKYLQDETPLDRYAHAIIAHGGKDVVVDYLVGPLPISENTTFRPRSENYHNPVPLNAHILLNWTMLAERFATIIAPIDPVTRDLFNGSILDGTLQFAGIAPTSYDGKWRRTWGQLRRADPGSWLQPLDMYFYVDMSGNDMSQYSVLKAVYEGKMYDGLDDLVAAWKEGHLTKSPPSSYEWATRAIRGKMRDLDDRAGPRSVHFDGARYRFDEKEQYVTWMGWAFYVGFERDMGVHLWDINFRGERIIYELSPQEAMAQYSGSDPHQGNSVWLDRTFGMGGTVRDVILGYDCPHDALLLSATTHERGTAVQRQGICVFERESGRPLSRHTGRAKNEMGAVKGYELVVRSVSSVGNYDYIFDYTFQLDGTIEIRVSASGYLQGGYWHEGDDDYGHRIHERNMGSLHDHVMNFKVDFDVAGTQNSFMAVSLEMEDKEAPWFDDDWGTTRHQQKIVRRILEEESLLEYPHNMEGAYVILNQNATNAWGNHRGYAVHPGPLCHLTNLDSKRTENSVNWAKHHLAVSKRKDDEPTSSSMWNMNLPGAPPVNFYKFFDNESIVQEDLVLWINLGTHHIPRAEDTPNTLTNVATSYVLLTPWNYNDHDVSIESRNSVLLNKKGGWVIEEQSISSATCSPPRPPKLAYRDGEAWNEDGKAINEDVYALISDVGTPLVAKVGAFNGRGEL
ncbi:copper amine oxidase [Kockovaella imperatae]|uniref:Amine oxidase n=1 Tax=Kockovaella imperatae TaxID=4999 RepID=A0A1Y1ULR5_9TREE|nr:copper amine oxidase [Kockovaella imperatae]ORX38990.1 copper amine oxidase [Kockovaella imperatae]